MNLQSLKVVIPGGGSGPISIEDTLLDFIPNVTAITNITDNGGHTQLMRTSLGVSPTGDATQRWAVRIRHNPNVRALLTYRFPENGQRAANTLLAAAEKITGSHAMGVKLIGEAFKAHVVGNVIPISNSKDTQLKVILNNNSSLEGEEKLDDFMKTKDNFKAVGIEFLPRPPEANPQALESFSEADLIIIPPGTRLGSLMAILEIPGVIKAISQSQAPIICFTNALDVKGWTASQFPRYLASKIGRKLDLVIINQPNFDLPTSYKQEYLFFVEPDEEECKLYAKQVIKTPVASLYQIDNKPTIRHNGEVASALILKFLKDHKLVHSPSLNKAINDLNNLSSPGI